MDENCWEYWGCNEEMKNNCSVFKSDLGKECWLGLDPYLTKAEREFKDCWGCPWYLKQHPTR